MNLILALLEVVFPAKKRAAVRIAGNISKLRAMLTEGPAKDLVNQIEKDMTVIRRWPPK